MSQFHGLRVNLGCGQSPIQGWVNFDSSPSVRLARLPFSGALSAFGKKLGLLHDEQAEYIRFCRKAAIRYGNGLRRLPLPSSSCQVVYSSHVLEHLAPDDEALSFLGEAFRILEPGARIRLAVPDLDILICNYQDNGNADAFISSLHVLHRARPKGLTCLNRLLAGDRSLHRWQYNKDSLSSLLAACGFINAHAYPPGETGIADPGTLNLRERAWESLYVEAIKPDALHDP